MKKRTTFYVIMALFIAMSIQSQTVVPLWENTGSNAPSWIGPTGTSGKARGVAYAKVGSAEHLYVATREPSDAVKILNASDASEVGTLNLGTDVIAGGTFTINEVGVSTDGKIFVCNLATSSAQRFNVYMWDSETATPVKVVDYDMSINTNIKRLGDRMIIKGSVSNGTAKILVPQIGGTTALGPSPVHGWLMEAKEGGGFQFNAAPTEFFTINIDAGTTYLTAPCIAIMPDGGVYWKDHLNTLKYKDKDGVTIAENVSNITGPNSNTLIHLGDDANKNTFLAVYGYTPSAPFVYKVDIIKVPNNDLTLAEKVATTPLIEGIAAGTSTGDLDLSYNDSDEPIVYMLAPNNGIAAYKITGLDVIPISTPFYSSVKNVNKEKLLYAIHGKLLEIKNNPVDVKIFNVQGVAMRSAKVDKINIDGLNGIYILCVKYSNGMTSVAKIKL